MKILACKRCNAPNQFWTQNPNGKWQLTDASSGKPHHCDDGVLKAVKCKFCNADDLHWGEETNPETKVTKPMLMESYGLPHACDAKAAYIAKQKSDKKNEYENIKKRVNEHPDGPCPPCKGTGNDLSNPNGFGLCTNCCGVGRFDVRTKKRMLANARAKIWPNMPVNFPSRRY